MIVITSAMDMFLRNIGRTNALIEAIDKIKAYNRLYQIQEAAEDPEYARLVASIQNSQLAWIEQSCAEHAIISLVTA